MAKKPLTVKVFAHDYKIKWHDEWEKQTGNWGNCSYQTLTINLGKKVPKTLKKSHLLHELLHAVNFHLSLGLAEEQINGLEAGLCQVLNDNDLERIVK